METRKILCVSPDGHCDAVAEPLRARNWELIAANDLASARRIQARQDVHVGLLLLGNFSAEQMSWADECVRMSQAMEWVGVFNQEALDCPFVRELVLSYFFDYHLLPVDWRMLDFTLDHALRRSQLRAQDEEGLGAVGSMGMVGVSEAITNLQKHIRKVAVTDAPVLISLDEVGNLPLELQTNLLRFLQERTIHRVGSTRSLPVDARVVAASHVDLADAVAAGRFREDLFYRLNVLPIAVPSLRERISDVPVLAQHFLQHCMADQNRRRVEGFSRQASAAMMACKWPGNVRELYNRVQRAVVMTDQRLITPEDLGLAAPMGQVGVGLEAIRTMAERDAITLTLGRVGRNVTHAARELGISRMTLYRLIDKHGLVHRAG